MTAFYIFSKKILAFPTQADIIVLVRILELNNGGDIMRVWVGKNRIDIDIIEELSNFNWYKERITDEKFTACSPFRYDNSPSFFVNLSDTKDGKEVAGTWLDSGALYGSDYKSGNFVTLLSFLRQETEEETITYLYDKYDFKPYVSELRLKLNLKIKQPFKPLREPEGELDTEYLPSRGIDSAIGEIAGVKYIKGKNAIALPWRNPMGEIQAIKYRKVDSKIFSYEEGGRHLNDLLYFIDYVTKAKCKTIAICEAEIDTLSWLCVGRGSVAVGGSNFSDVQASQLIRTGAENLIISTDNDKVGQALASQIIKKVGKYFNIYKAVFPEGCKDMNDFIRQYPNQRPKVIKLNRKFM